MIQPKTILITNRTNIRYFSGFSGTAGYVVLQGASAGSHAVKARGATKGFLFTDARYHLVAKKVLPRNFSLIDITGGFESPWKSFLKKYHVTNVGIEGGDMTVKFFNWLKKNSPGVALQDVGTTLDEKRIIKTKDELTKINRAQEITDAIFKILKRWIRVGVTELDIAWKIEALAHELGADDISFPPIIGINEHSASPHHQNTDRKLKRGDLILIDMGVIYKGYCSDMTRMLFTKAPTKEEEKIYMIVWDAQEAAIKKLRAGTYGDIIDSVARDYIAKKGCGKYFGHSLGHGVGLDIHELPNLSQKYTNKPPLPANTIVTVEPGIYLEGKFGVRLEDMLQVTRTGAINLTATPKELKSCVISI